MSAGDISPGTAGSSGTGGDLLRSHVEEILQNAVDDTVTPGAVCSIAERDAPVVTVAVGHLASHDDSGQLITPAEREPTTEDTLYDLASITKIFSAITILRLADRGAFELDAPVTEFLAEYRPPEKSQVTLAHLLSHTSGLPPTWSGWHGQVATNGAGTAQTNTAGINTAGAYHARWMPVDRSIPLGRILALDLLRPPGQNLEYSCLGYITAMAVAEQATGQTWPELVAEHVLKPLQLTQTTFSPDARRTAPTEYEPQLGRGMVRGIVHDETAHALGGGSANAGLFAPVSDVLALGRGILAGLPGILSETMFDRLWDNQLPAMLGARAGRAERISGFGQSLGLRIGQAHWMGRDAAGARGHTGFTGTSLKIDHDTGVVLALLTNRVHPSRNGPDLAPTRAAVADVASGV